MIRENRSGILLVPRLLSLCSLVIRLKIPAILGPSLDSGRRARDITKACFIPARTTLAQAGYPLVTYASIVQRAKPFTKAYRPPIAITIIARSMAHAHAKARGRRQQASGQFFGFAALWPTPSKVL